MIYLKFKQAEDNTKNKYGDNLFPEEQFADLCATYKNTGMTPSKVREEVFPMCILGDQKTHTNKNIAARFFP